MSTEKEMLYDLLVKKAIHGLDENEQQQLDSLDRGQLDADLNTLEMTAAAIDLAALEIEPMPASLRSALDEAAERHFSESATIVDQDAAPWPPVRPAVSADEPRRAVSWFGWLGWAAAAAACVALVLNIWFSRQRPQEIVRNVPPPVSTPAPTPAPQDPAEMRDNLIDTAADLIRVSWTAGNVKGLTDLVGDIVWSDERQAGYMTFKNLPANDPNAYTYQLWIMDKSQDKATPIDGGTFNVNANGEIVVPIDAKLKAHSPEMFAVTMEKPGGVVVSKREKIVAVAKVETSQKPST